jgi:hypothetical protein
MLKYLVMSEVPALKEVELLYSGLPDPNLNEKPRNTRKKSQKDFTIFFIHTSHENLQIQVITILSTGMSESMQAK